MNPSAQRLAAHATVAEERGLWVLGRMRAEPHAFFELGYEHFDKLPPQCRLHPDVPVTYLGLHVGKKVVGEFELSRWHVVPTDPDVKTFIINLMGALRHYRPIPVIDHNEILRQYRLSLASGALAGGTGYVSIGTGTRGAR